MVEASASESVGAAVLRRPPNKRWGVLDDDDNDGEQVECRRRVRQRLRLRLSTAPSWAVAVLVVIILAAACCDNLCCEGTRRHPYDETMGRMITRLTSRDSGGRSAASTASVDLGTTLVAIKYRNGVVVGADSRTSVSNYVSHRFAHKISMVAPHILVARSGSAADTQHLAEHVRKDLIRRSIRYGISANTFPPSSIAHYLKNAVYDSDDGMSASLIVAGFDAAVGQPTIYTIAPSGALLEESIYAMAGSGSALITGFLDEQLSTNGESTSSSSPPSNAALDEDRAVELCRKAIELAVQRDGSSGGVARIYVCDANGVRDVTKTSRSPDRIVATIPVELDGFASPGTS